MTRQSCNAGPELPPNVSCGGVCDIFPACLPPPSPELVASVMALRASLLQEHAQHRASMRTLMVLQRAISGRISVKD
jgi:hypothetical protein